MIQLRNVPETLHRRLKSRAALEGVSLSDYLLKEVEKMSELPTMEEMRARLASREPIQLKEDPAEAVRAEHDSR